MDDKTHYIVVTGILVRDGKYLITKRADWEKAFPGMWTVPGGKLESKDYINRPKDTTSHWYNIFEDLLKREIKEEVNLEIKDIGYVTSMVYIRPDNIPCVIVSLFAFPVNDEIKLCNALSDFKWVSLEEARNYDLIEGIYEELQMLDNLLKNKKENMGEWRKESNIINEIRKFVEEECKKPTSKYGDEPFQGHFIPVVKYSKILGEKKNADLEILEIAALLHDIGSIIYGRENHHITGSEIAEKKLRELNYPEDRIEKVKHCIITHRGSQSVDRLSVEAQILADADSMSHFDNITGPLKAALVYENLNQFEAADSVRNKLIRSYNKLSEDAKQIIKPKYDAAMLLLGGNENGI